MLKNPGMLMTSLTLRDSCLRKSIIISHCITIARRTREATFVGDPLKNPFISVAQSNMLISTGGDKISDTNSVSVPEEIGYNLDDMLDEEFDVLVPNGEESVSRDCNESASSEESLSSDESPSGTPLVDDYDSLEGTYSHSVNSLDLRGNLRLKEDGPQEPAIRPGDVIETYAPNGTWGR